MEFACYFVFHRERSLPQMDLYNALWTDDRNDNPMSALKTLLYRTRMLLEPEIGDIQLILSQRGSYSWNPDIQCDIDAEQFEILCRKASDATGRERLFLYREAVRLYRGDFLPKLSGELWVIPLTTHYHSLYLEAVTELGKLLREQELYEELTALCGEALLIDNLDEGLHCLMISAYLHQGNVSAALNHYETTVDLLYRNLGTRPSTELRNLYGDIMKERKRLETDLSVIQESLQEHAEENGAFVCEYGFFKEAYRLESRRSTRNGSCVHIGLITVSSSVGEVPPLDVLNPAMDHLLECIRGNLRRGDVISRYSVAQYVLMLPTANFEDGEMVMERIVSAFHRKSRKGSVRLTYQLRPLELSRPSSRRG